MKKSVFMIVLAAITLTACNSQTENEEHDTISHAEEMMQHEHADGEHHGDNMENETATTTTMEVPKSDATAPLLSAYLMMKDALVSDDPSMAAQEAGRLNEAITKFDLEANARGKIQEVEKILADANEHTEHIADNEGNIEHQREHFKRLSSNMKDLITLAGADRQLYQEYCPMYNRGDGGMWLSDNSEIRNPYYGSKMLKCGKVETEISLQ